MIRSGAPETLPPPVFGAARGGTAVRPADWFRSVAVADSVIVGVVAGRARVGDPTPPPEPVLVAVDLGLLVLVLGVLVLGVLALGLLVVGLAGLEVPDVAVLEVAVLDVTGVAVPSPSSSISVRQ
jgi:hypothetical protein